MDMHAIAQSIGYRPSVRRSDPKASHGVKVRRTRWDLEMSDGDLDNYRSSQDEQAVWRRVVGLEFEDFAGPVYNLHVEGDESYVVEGIGVHNCVGHAWAGWLQAAPMRTMRGPSPYAIYDRCVLIDEWAQNDQDPNRQFGTSVRAGAKVLAEQGRVAEYLWAFDVDTVRRWVLGGRGTVVLGIEWHGGMMRPDNEGFVRPIGGVVGGHAILLCGIDDRRGFATMQNSWGTDYGGWGQNGRSVGAGRCRISLEHLDELIRRDGEAATAVEKAIERRP